MGGSDQEHIKYAYGLELLSGIEAMYWQIICQEVGHACILPARSQYDIDLEYHWEGLR